MHRNSCPVILLPGRRTRDSLIIAVPLWRKEHLQTVGLGLGTSWNLIHFFTPLHSSLTSKSLQDQCVGLAERSGQDQPSFSSPSGQGHDRLAHGVTGICSALGVVCPGLSSRTWISLGSEQSWGGGGCHALSHNHAKLGSFSGRHMSPPKPWQRAYTSMVAGCSESNAKVGGSLPNLEGHG